MLMAGCSKDVHTAETPGNQDLDLNTPVPIQFGVGSPATKAGAINTNDDLVGKTIGVFAVDKNAASWSGGTADRSVYLNNEPAYISKDDSNDEVTYSVNFGYSSAGHITKYYPLLSSEDFTFYGYYTLKGEVDMTATTGANHITVPVNLGATDVLWAKAEAVDFTIGVGPEAVSYPGYNARYIRALSKDEIKAQLDQMTFEGARPAMPHFNFKHPTALINISVQKIRNEIGGTNEQTLVVNSLSLNNIPSRATLCIANKEVKEQEGTFIEVLERPASTMMTKNGTGNLAFEVPLTATEMGSMFIYPQDQYDQDGDGEPELVEVLTGQMNISVNGTPGQVIPFEINPANMGANHRGFMAGYEYNITIKVHEAIEIEITTEVTSYVDAFGTTGKNEIVIE